MGERKKREILTGKHPKQSYGGEDQHAAVGQEGSVGER